MAWTRNRPIGLTWNDPEQAFGGYTIFSPVNGHNALCLDPDGRVVHRWFHPDGIQHLKLLDNGNLLIQGKPPSSGIGQHLIGGSAVGFVELDWDSEVVWEHRDDMLHHDYVRLDDGDTLALAWEQLPIELAGSLQGGHRHRDDPDRPLADVIKRISPGGTARTVWRSWEHLSFDHHRICPLESHKEWTHANSLALTPDGDWLVSFRLTSTVVALDRRTGDVTWRWGEDELSHQHSASWLENGNVLLFDNGCHRPRGPSFSRIVEVDPVKREIAWNYRGENSLLSFYSFMVSGCDRLPNGNTFVTEGATGRMFEVTPEFETVWEYVSPWLLTSPRFGPTAAVFRAYKVGADHPGLAGRNLEPGRFASIEARIDSGEPWTGTDEEALPEG